MKKNLLFITIASFLTVLFGIAGNIASYYSIEFFDKFKDSKILSLISGLSPLYLNIKTHMDKIDVWEIFLLMLLFFGAILFVLKKGKETRLIGFVFSIIFISSISSVFIKLFNLSFMLKSTYKNPSFVFLYLGYSAIISVVYLVVSYIILKKIKKEKEFDIVITETSKKYRDTVKWQRFFHWLIDSLIIALVFIPVIYSIVFRLYIQDESGGFNIERFENYHKIFANNFLTLGLIVLLRFIYYPVFEILFGSTPAKFLTESRVVTTRTENPGASTIFTRTFYRNVPFDSISFFWENGWHDSLSHSYVVKEKRTGFKTSQLVWVFVVFVIYIFTYFFGIDLYNDYQRKEMVKSREELLRQNIASSVKNINENQIYKLESIYDPSGNEELYLKIRKVNGNNVETEKLLPSDFYSNGLFLAREAMRKNEIDSQPFFLKKSDLSDAILKKNYPYSDEVAKKGTYYTYKNIPFKIAEVYDLNVPIFELTNERAYYPKDPGETLSIKNLGAAGKVLSLESKIGDLEIFDTFPKYFSAYDATNYQEQIVRIKTSKINSEKNYLLEMNVLDSQGHKLKYQIIITKWDAFIDRIK